jgi:succinate dehydrogenase hydrophobic membrane anchor protein
MRLSTTKLSGRRGSRPEPPPAMKVTKSATKTSTMQVIRVVQPNARDGLREWRLQRLTAIAVIPLSLHFAASILSVATSGRKTAADWLALPVLALVVILVVLMGITHALIGLGSVVLDYVRSHRLPVAELLSSIIQPLAIKCRTAGATRSRHVTKGCMTHRRMKTARGYCQFGWLGNGQTKSTGRSPGALGRHGLSIDFSSPAEIGGREDSGVVHRTAQ